MPLLTDSSLPLKVALTSPFSTAFFIFQCLGAPLPPLSGPRTRTSKMPSPPQGPPEPEVPILGLAPLSPLYFSVPLGVPWSEARVPGHSWGHSGHCLIRPGLAKAGLGGAGKQEAPSPGHMTCYCAVSSSRTEPSSSPSQGHVSSS